MNPEHNKTQDSADMSLKAGGQVPEARSKRRRDSGSPHETVRSKMAKYDGAESGTEDADDVDGNEPTWSRKFSKHQRPSFRVQNGESWARSKPYNKKEIENSSPPNADSKATQRKRVGWADLSGELRNHIYGYVLSNDEGTNLVVAKFPKGWPRRSLRWGYRDTNFAYSSWGFTQTCQQVRKELRPQLVMKKTRRVRTPVQTLDEYVEVFHAKGANGQRVGFIEPFSKGEPLTGNGVEIISLLKHCDQDPDFDVHFTYEAVEAVSSGKELQILFDLKAEYEKWVSEAEDWAGIETMRLTSTRWDENDEESGNDIVVKLGLTRPKELGRSLERQVEQINAFLVRSGLIDFDHLHIKYMARYRGQMLEWLVVRDHVIDLLWTSVHKVRSRFEFVLNRDNPERFTVQRLY